jgi:hypothetical protein
VVEDVHAEQSPSLDHLARETHIFGGWVRHP